MARCNAFFGEPMPDSIFFCCQLPKKHAGKHNFRNGEIEVFWSKDDRQHFFERMRKRPIGHRFMRIEKGRENDKRTNYYEFRKIIS